MKTKLLFLITIFGTLTVIAQPDISWERSLGGTNNEEAYSVIQTTDGGYIVAGYSMSGDIEASENHGASDIWVVKLDAYGSVQWEKSYGGSGGDIAYSIEQTSDGGYILIGGSGSDDFQNIENYNDFEDIVILKLNNLGELEWGKFYGTNSTDRGQSIKQTSDGGYIAVGYVGAGSHYDAWVAKLDSSGEIDPNWNNTIFGGPNFGDVYDRYYNDGAYSVDETNDGYIVAGFTGRENESGNSNNDFWVLKFNNSGDLLWDQVLGGSSSEVANSIQQSTDGSFIVAGRTESNDGDVSGSNGSRDYWVVKLNAIGEMQWQNVLGGSLLEEALSISQTSDNGYIVLGYSNSTDGDISNSITPSNNDEFWLVKLNESGNLLWEKCLGGSATNKGYSVEQTLDGGYILAGYTSSSDYDVSANDRSGYIDFWVVKLEAEALGINETEYGLESIVYPNPAENEIYIKTDLNVNGLALYDLIGKQVLTKKGTKVINVSQLKSGLYILKVETDKGQITKKIVVE